MACVLTLVIGIIMSAMCLDTGYRENYECYVS